MTRLDLKLLLKRIGPLPVIAVALMAAAALVHLLGTVPVETLLGGRSEQTQRLRAIAAQPIETGEPEKPLNEQRLTAFESMLCEKREVHRIIGTVFVQAEKHGLTLAQAEYKLEFDKPGGFYQYQMTLPVRGPYPQLRRFVHAALMETSCAALEDVDFKRDGIGAAETEARLRILFALKDAAS